MAISSNGLAGLKPGVVDNAAARPSSPFEGQMVYEKDIDMLAIWNGTAWRYIAATTPTNGTVLQVVTGSTTTGVNTATSTFVDTGLTATITPKSSSSKVFILVSQNGLLKQNNTSVNVRLLRTATTLSDFVIEGSLTSTTANNVTQASVSYLDSPATTSATTYKTQYASAANIGSVHAQYASAMSTITLMEIAG